MIGLSAVFADCPFDKLRDHLMPLRGNDPDIDFPEIGVAFCALTINSRQQPP
jgi:hypothetical protein